MSTESLTASVQHMRADRNSWIRNAKATLRLSITLKALIKRLKLEFRFVVIRKMCFLFSFWPSVGEDPSPLVGYEAWFDELVAFWLSTWREQSEQLVQSAIDSDRQFAAASDRIAVAASAVNVLTVCSGVSRLFPESCICTQVVEDLNMIGFQYLNRRISTTIKMTEFVCDNVVGYCRCVVRAMYRSHSGNIAIVCYRLCQPFNPLAANARRKQRAPLRHVRRRAIAANAELRALSRPRRVSERVRRAEQTGDTDRRRMCYIQCPRSMLL